MCKPFIDAPAITCMPWSLNTGLSTASRLSSNTVCLSILAGVLAMSGSIKGKIEGGKPSGRSFIISSDLTAVALITFAYAPSVSLKAPWLVKNPKFIDVYIFLSFSFCTTSAGFWME